MSKRYNKFSPEEAYERLIKSELSEDDRKYFGSLAQEFKASAFWPLFLAITNRERHLLGSSRETMHTTRPDFVLGMIHENCVIENAVDSLIEEKNRIIRQRIEKARHGKTQDAEQLELGVSAYREKFGKD